MKLNKFFIISIILIIFLSISAISAENTDNALSTDTHSNDNVLSTDSRSNENALTNENTLLTDTHSNENALTTDPLTKENTHSYKDSEKSLSSDAFNKTIYVNKTGSDEGDGSEANPYATLKKSISQLDDSDNAVIYIGPGNYTGENNSALEINLDHKDHDGSLSIIGDSNGGTVFDGENLNPIIISISEDSIVTLINITFTHGKNNMGSAIRSSGNLTIDNCIFTENYATNLAALYVDKHSPLTVMNSKFLENRAKQCADIYFSQNSEIILLNNLFEGSTAEYSYAYSPSVSLQTGKSLVKGNTFKNLTGAYYKGALYIAYNNGINIANITDNTFINCNYTGTDGAILFFQNAYLKNNKFIDCHSSTAFLYSNTEFNAYLSFEDAEIDGTTFFLKANVTDDMGNKVKNAKVIFYLNGENVGSASSDNNGVAMISIKKLLENGEYVISGTQSYSEINPFGVNVKNATARVNYDHSSLEVWVSTDGDDGSGNGSEDNPFKTLRKALDYGTASAVNLTVHVKNGIYNGDDNRDLSYSTLGKITIVGESYSNVVIDGENITKSIFAFSSTLDVTLINLTLINCPSTLINAYTLSMMDNIVINSGTIRAQTGNNGVTIDNLRVINGTDQAITGYNLRLTNSRFENCDGLTHTGLIWLSTNNNKVTYLENNTFFNNTIAGSAGGGAAYYIQSDLISINNTFDSNWITESRGENVAYAGGRHIISINDKFINNEVPKYVAQYRSIGNEECEIIVENITFINNKASGNGAGLATTGAIVKGGKFINNSASGNGGAIYLLNHDNTSSYCQMSLEDVIFENNSATCGKDIFIEGSSGNNIFTYLNNLTIVANDLNVTSLSDNLTVSVFHPSGAIIGGGEISFYLDGEYIGKSTLVNQNASLEYVGFKNNTIYEFTSIYEYASLNDTYIDGIVSTKIPYALENIELYVSDGSGDDENGNGSISNPFKSISKALSEGYQKSTNITVHILEGTYTGSLNSNLRIPTTVNILLIGEGAAKTIISDSSSDYFITALKGKCELRISQMTLNRAARDTQSAIYIEEESNVAIDNVTFIGGQGNYGGAINTAGNLSIRNSYFHDNGYADRTLRANAYYGGAICNDGTLIIDNTIFESDHAGRLSEIANQGTLYMNNSKVIDSINAYSINMDLVAIGAYGGQKGEITIENSQFIVSSKTINELNDRIYDPTRALTCLGIGSCQHAILINSTFIGEGAVFSPYVFGGINSNNLASGGCTMIPGDLEVYNSTFRNVQAVNIIYSRTDNVRYHSQRVFEGCLFDNVEYIIAVLNTGNFSVEMHDCVILSDDLAKIGFGSEKTMKMDISNNWWSSNDGSYDNATLGTTNYISNCVVKLKEISSETVHPESYLILTLNSSNRTGLLQDAILAFKAYDGENISDYDGALYPRNFEMSAINATLDDLEGTIINKAINPFEGVENSGYYIEAIVDNQKVNLTVHDSLSIGNAYILAENISINYNETQINVTVLEENGKRADGGNVSLKLHDKTYISEIINGTAIFDIDVLPKGDYLLNYSLNRPKVYHSISNSSNLTVIPFKINAYANASNIKVGEDAIVIAYLDKDAGGNVTLGEEIQKVNDGTATFIISNLAKGDYTYQLSYSGDEKYDNETFHVSFSVNLKDASISVENDTLDLFVGSNETIVATISPIGLAVNYSCSNESVAMVDENGVVSAVGAGMAVITLTVGDDVTYSKNSSSVTVIVSKIPTIIEIVNDTISLEVTDSLDSIASLNPEEGGNLNYAISDDLIAKIDNGQITALSEGSAIITVSFDGNDKYTKAQNKSIKIIVNLKEASVSAFSNIDLLVGENDTLSPKTSPEGLDVRYESNDTSVVLVDNGQAIAVGEGNATITLTVGGDGVYAENTTTVKVSVSRIATMIEIEKDTIELKVNEESPIGAILEPDVGNLTYSISDESIAKVENGKIIALAEGNASLSISFAGDERYIGTNASVEIRVNKINTILTETDITTTYKEEGYLIATLKDSQNNPISGAVLTVDLDGIKNYTTDSNGQIKIATNNLIPDTYTARISFAGNENYSSSNGNASVTVKRIGTKLNFNDMNTTAFDSNIEGRIGEYFYFQLVDCDGNPLANKKVIIGFNGVKYNRQTNETGWAKIQINLKYANSYTFAIAFLGDDNYSGSFNFAVIRVSQQTPKLTASSKTYKSSAKTKTLTATLKSSSGKAIAGKKISFRLNGKVYTANTNSLGVATVKVSLNKKGTYSFTAQFSGDSTYKKVTKTAKLTIK
ncbi:adhesin-like protein [Methanobrevibacter ruminantium M1]|uniref:Intimin n=1 Tax=Methanobrevibacter ruminantium (strain ATCC 35063 / DSM 1093 / JCM 13430 / OCM 146 / M1) TaxID=634498 RepID=D3DZ26_METRM|nr:Ig-like domain repeat protein [Methanobrevibacter ruminantium]ADC47576.1 adhesin-like protein [Methanobrevibacter ruminantium M1]